MKTHQEIADELVIVRAEWSPLLRDRRMAIEARQAELRAECALIGHIYGPASNPIIPDRQCVVCGERAK